MEKINYTKRLGGRSYITNIFYKIEDKKDCTIYSDITLLRADIKIYESILERKLITG